MRYTNMNSGAFFEITKVPGRKKPVLILGNEKYNQEHIVASFTDDDTAENAITFMHNFFSEGR